MKHALFLAAALSFVAAPMTAVAAPYCDEMASKDTLPSKYKKRGPFYSDVDSGWIFGADQLRVKFDVTDEVAHLWGRINAEFEAKGVRLVVLAPPPRPLFASSETRTAAGVPSSYDADATSQAYDSYVEALAAAGIETPNLLAAASNAAEPFYFQRDTHWTPAGAAVSAAALADVMGMNTGDVTPEFKGDYSEKGSLSTVAEKVCGTRPAAELVRAANYAKAGDAASLLGDGPESANSIALVGTSFSNRYQRDAYQVADAIAHFTGASVENLSISGGGMTGAMEAFVRSGDLAKFDVVVWEAPYTEPLTNISGLRQILGALVSNRGVAQGKPLNVKLSDDWVNVKTSPDMVAADALAIQIAGVETGQLHVEFIDADNKKTRVKLHKSDRVSQDMRSDVWTVALEQIDMSKIARIKFRLKGVASTQKAVLSALSL